MQENDFDFIGKIISTTIGICVLLPLFVEIVLNLFNLLTNKKEVGNENY